MIKWRWQSGSPWIYELYDLARDPQAKRNLLPGTEPPPPAFYTALHRLESWVGAIGLELDGAEPAPRRSLPPAALDQLEALGYR